MHASLMQRVSNCREPPKATVTMVKACNVAITLGFCFYTLVGVLGYAGLGNVGVTGNVLQSFNSPRRGLSARAPCCGGGPKALGETRGRVGLAIRFDAAHLMAATATSTSACTQAVT